MTANLLGLICLSAGCVIGWSLRWSEVARLERRNDELLDDLDAAVRDIAATIGRQNHPSGRNLRSVR